MKFQPSPEVIAERKRIANLVHKLMEETVAMREQSRSEVLRNIAGKVASDLARLATDIRSGKC